MTGSLQMIWKSGRDLYGFKLLPMSSVIKSINQLNQTFNFFSGVEYLQQYGWFILLGVLILLYIKTKLDPKIRKLKSKAEDISYQKKFGE